MKLFLQYLCAGLIGMFLSMGGIHYNQWQFWAILITFCIYGELQQGD